MMRITNSLRNRRLAFFFTFNVSLKTWHDKGMLAREVALYNKLSKYFEQIYFFTYGDCEDLKFQRYLENNITIIPFTFLRINKHSRSIFLIKLIYSLFLPIIHRRILKDVDIFKTNQIMGAWTAIIAKLLYRKKLVVRQGYQLSIFLKRQGATPILRLFVWLLELISYHIADEVMVTSESDKNYIIEKYHLNKHKVIVIPNYVDTEQFRPLSIKKDTKRIIFVGRLDPQKNLFSLVDAVKGLNVELVIVGGGLLKEKLKKKIIKEDIDNVKLLGVIPNEKLSFELNKSHLFILPSFYEGNPKAFLEAMACGLPVIGTDVEGIKGIIKHEENGFLCNTDAESIRKAIITLMYDKELMEKISLNARKYVEENFSLEKIVKTELKLYLALCGYL